MSQNDFNLANQGFPAMRADMNSAFQALASNSSGATEPGTTYAYQWWYDETTDILKMRNADDDAWINIASFDQANDTWSPYVGATALTATGAELNLLDGAVDHATAAWEAGTATEAGVPSPADVKAAIDALGGGGTPTGSIIWHAGITAPTGYLKANGAAVSRTTYADLLAAITFTDATADTTNTSTTVTLDDTSLLGAGMGIEGAGIPTGTTISSVDSGTQITLSQAATATASNITVTVFPFGTGDGSTTFDLPDMRAEFARGWDDGRSVDSGRVFGSAQADELKAHTHSAFEQRNDTNGDTRGAATASPTTGSLFGNTTSSTGGAETRPRNIALLACIKF